MAKGPSKARESRVNIAISDRLKGGAEPELPFRMLVMGDYTLKDDGRPIYDRNPVDINKSNFDAVMQSFNLSLDLSSMLVLHTRKMPSAFSRAAAATASS